MSSPIVDELSLHQLIRIKKFLKWVEKPTTINQLYLYIDSDCVSIQQKQLYVLKFLEQNKKVSQDLHEQENKQLPYQLLILISQKLPYIYQKLSYQNVNLWQILKLKPTIITIIDKEQINHYIMKFIYTNYLLSKQQNISKRVLLGISSILQKLQDDQTWLSIWSKIYLKFDSKQIKATSYQILLMINLLHRKQPFKLDGQVQTSKIFKQHLKACLLDIQPLANSISCDIYSKIVQSVQCPALKIFFNLYDTLGSFGTHLIKDVWDSFYTLCQCNISLNIIFQFHQLIGIIIARLSQHKNLNVIKYCIQSILNYSNPKIFFTAQVVFESFIPSLNDGIHFQDCPFYQDSKTYKLIQCFFSKYLNSPQITIQQRKKSLSKLLISIEKCSLQVCAIGLLSIFDVIEVQTDFLDLDNLNKSISIINKLYQRVPLRKKIQVMNSWFSLIQKHLSPLIDVEYIFNKIILQIPQDYFKFVNDNSTLRSNFSKISIKTPNIINYIKSQNQFFNVQFIRSLFIFQIHQHQNFQVFIKSQLEDFYQTSYKTYQQRINLLNTVCLSTKYYKYKQIINTYQLIDLIKTTALMHCQNNKNTQIQNQVEYNIIQLIKWININENQQYFIQLCIQQINQPIFYKILIELLKRKIKKQSIQNIDSVNLILLKINNNKIPKSIKLRIQTLCECVMMNNIDWLQNNKIRIKDQILQLVDKYDFEQYQQLLIYIQSYYVHVLSQNMDYNQYFKAVSLIIDSTLQNLNYAITSYNVQKILLQNKSYVKQCAVPLSIKIIKIGKQYWLFQRSLINHLIPILQKNQQIIFRCIEWVDLFCQLIWNEQYRGYQSKIALGVTYERYSNIFQQNVDYDGQFIRFVMIEWVNRILKNNINQQIKSFMLLLFQKLLENCLKQKKKQKMFMSGTHKIKIKSWQCIMSFSQFIGKYHKDQSKLLQSLLETLEHNNLSAIKFYIQIFIARLFQTVEINQNTFIYFSNKLSQLLNVNKSLPYLILSGILLQVKYNEKLFHLLLVYSCSHIAYFRAVSEYFCFTKLPMVSQSQIIKTMKAEFEKSLAAQQLSKKIDGIITQFKHYIKNWNPYYYLFLKRPNDNGEVTDYDLMDEFKRLAHSSQNRQNDFQDGYNAIKEIWKKFEIKDIQLQSQTFQKKIDPNLNKKYLHNYSLKLIVASVTQVSSIGHFARIGQIFGIESIILKDLKILERDDFRNVSCTAEKWINFKEFRTQEGLISMLKQSICEGKCQSTVKYNDKSLLNKRSILLIDQMKIVGTLPNIKQLMVDQVINMVAIQKKSQLINLI